MGERLRGSKVIYHRKPSPNFLGVDPVLDEDASVPISGKSLTAARGLQDGNHSKGCVYHSQQHS